MNIFHTELFIEKMIPMFSYWSFLWFFAFKICIFGLRGSLLGPGTGFFVMVSRGTGFSVVLVLGNEMEQSAVEGGC